MTDLSQLSTAELRGIIAAERSTAPRKVVTPNKPIASEFESADTTTGADFMTRFGASFKMTPAGKVDYLKHKYGEKNVLVDEKGNIFFRPKDGARLTLFDEKDLSLADLADFGGDLPGVIFSAIGGASGTAAGPGPGNVGGAALGALVGNQLKQAISGFMAGDDNMTAGDRLTSMGTDFAMGGASQYGANKAMALRDVVRPGNIVARSAQRAEATPFAQQGRQLSAETGIPLSFADETGSRAAKTIEGMARRNPVSADTFSAFDRLQTEKAVQRIRGIMDDIHGSEVGDESLGQSANRAFDKLWDNLVAARRSTAQSDFSLVHKLSAGKPVLPTIRMKDAVNGLISEYDVPGAGPMAKKFVSELTEMRDEIGLATTAEHFQKLLQRWGKAASGGATIFENLDRAEQRRVAGKVFGALTKDLDAAASTGAGTDALASALRTARDNYAKNSAAMAEVGDSVIGRYFGNVGYERTAERVADTLSRMKPTEIRATMGILSRADPDIVDKTARHFLERAMDAARPAAGQSQGGTVAFSSAKFLNALPDEKVLQAVIGGKPAQGELTKVAKVLERVADRPMEGSPTAPIMMAWDLAKGLFTLNPQALAGLPVAVLAPRTIAAAALTPQGRQALITVSTTGKPTKVVLHAAQYLAALNVKEANQDVSGAIAAGATSGAPTGP